MSGTNAHIMRQNIPSLAHHYTGRVVGVAIATCLCVHAAVMATTAEAQTSPTSQANVTVWTKPQIIIAPQIVIPQNVTVPLPIAYKAPPGGLPPFTFIRLKQLPRQTTLTQGYKVSETTWAIPLDRLEKLQIRCGQKRPVDKYIRVQLISLDGQIHDDRTIRLISGIKLPTPPKLVSRDAVRDRQIRQRAADVMSATADLTVGGRTSSDRAEAGAHDILSTQEMAKSQFALPPQDREKAKRLLSKGNEFLLQGNIVTARLFYRRAADLGFSPGAMALAATFDPNELSRLGIIGMQGDINSALIWYERAAKLGDPAAVDRLKRLVK